MSEDHETLLKKELSQAILSISDKEIRAFTAALLGKVDDAVWKKRASRKHHPLDERRAWGNLLHTLRVVKLVGVISECCEFSTHKVDVLMSAALLHDICRFGLDNSAEYTVPEHPWLVREFAGSFKLPECASRGFIFNLVETHMGKWGVPPAHSVLFPGTALHLADAISAHGGEVWKATG